MFRNTVPRKVLCGVAVLEELTSRESWVNHPRHQVPHPTRVNSFHPRTSWDLRSSSPARPTRRLIRTSFPPKSYQRTCFVAIIFPMSFCFLLLVVSSGILGIKISECFVPLCREPEHTLWRLCVASKEEAGMFRHYCTSHVYHVSISLKEEIFLLLGQGSFRFMLFYGTVYGKPRLLSTSCDEYSRQIISGN